MTLKMVRLVGYDFEEEEWEYIYILGSFLNLIVQQTFSNPHNTPFKEWQNWFLSTNLWHFSGRKTFHLFWNIIVHRVLCGWVRTTIHYFTLYRFTKVLFTGKCMLIVFWIYRKNHARIEIYFFSSNDGKLRKYNQPKWKIQFCQINYNLHVQDERKTLKLT